MKYLQYSTNDFVNPPQNMFKELQSLMSQTENWNYRIAEYTLWRHFFDQFWLLVTTAADGSIICSVSLALQHKKDGSKLYSIGNFYCVPQWRGKGLSKILFEKVMKIVGDDNCFLYGAKPMVEFYKNRFGFSKTTDFWHFQVDILKENLLIPSFTPTHGELFEVKKITDWEKLHEYDEKLSGLNRKKYMRANLTLPDTFSRVVYNAEGRLVGFGAIKMATDNYAILAPLYAESYEAALSLVSVLLKDVKNVPFSRLISIYPRINDNMIRLIKTISRKVDKDVESYRHQFTGQFVQYPQSKIFATDEICHSPI